ncbi:MAG: hypothetical protein O3A01_06345 [bacterium]|nr:hypothetical protein [bacterium]
MVHDAWFWVIGIEVVVVRRFVACAVSISVLFSSSVNAQTPNSAHGRDARITTPNALSVSLLNDTDVTPHVIQISPGVTRVVIVPKKEYLTQEVNEFRHFKDWYFRVWAWLVFGYAFAAAI